MANFCPNCGSSVDSYASFCPSCGCALNGGAAATQTPQSSYTDNTASTVAGVLGTLVAVNLIGGMTRQLYYYGGRYFLDPYCRTPFGSPHMIMGPHRIMPRPPVRPPMGRAPMGRPPVGGPGRGPRPGGPQGGPRGGGPGGRPGGHR